jgi:prevent-host-death family protein
MNMTSHVTQVPAASLKAECLCLVDEVAARRQPIVVTKRGKAVARLVPVDNTPIGSVRPAAFAGRYRAGAWPLTSAPASGAIFRKNGTESSEITPTPIKTG